MADEPTVFLREYLEHALMALNLRLDQRFEAQQSAISTAIENSRIAVAKAETATEKRFDAVNEFRQQAADRDAAFLTKVEFYSFRDAQQSQLRWLATTLIAVAGLGATSVIGIVGLLLTR